MAITNNGTSNSLPSNKVPSDYTRPTVTEITDYDYSRVIQLSVLKATVENVDPATTMTNIISNATIGITKQIDDILAADFLATATVTAFADLIQLDSNIGSTDPTTDFLKNTAVSYTCTVRYYVKAS